MKRTILGITLALAASAALATQDHTCQGGHNCNTTGGSTATATVGNINVKPEITNVNAQGQQQGQVQGQQQGQKQGQSQTATGGAATGGSAVNSGVTGNSVNMTFNEKLQPGSVSVAATTTTASCMVAVSGGVSFPGGGVGFGTAYKDDKCDKRALGLALIDSARVAKALGASDEYVAGLFTAGVDLLQQSAKTDEAPAAKKTTGGATAESMNP